MSYYGHFPQVFAAWHPYTQRYIAAMTTKPSPLVAQNIDRFVRGLLTDNLWGKFDALYIFKMHDAQAARLNLVNPGTYDLSLVGAPTFTAGSGYLGGASAYLQTSVNMSTFAKFRQNDAHLGVYFTASSTINVGVIGNQSNVNEIRGSSPGNQNSYAMCNASYVFAEALRTFANGHRVVARPSSTVYRHIGNGVQLGADNTRASSAVAASSLKVCGGINGNETASTVEIAHAGSNITVAESNLLYNRILSYRTGYP